VNTTHPDGTSVVRELFVPREPTDDTISHPEMLRSAGNRRQTMCHRPGQSEMVGMRESKEPAMPTTISSPMASRAVDAFSAQTRACTRSFSASATSPSPIQADACHRRSPMVSKIRSAFSRPYRAAGRS
jgi:hypothetical protein